MTFIKSTLAPSGGFSKANLLCKCSFSAKKALKFSFQPRNQKFRDWFPTYPVLQKWPVDASLEDDDHLLRFYFALWYQDPGWKIGEKSAQNWPQTNAINRNVVLGWVKKQNGHWCDSPVGNIKELLSELTTEDNCAVKICKSTRGLTGSNKYWIEPSCKEIPIYRISLP